MILILRHFVVFLNIFSHKSKTNDFGMYVFWTIVLEILKYIISRATKTNIGVDAELDLLLSTYSG